MFASTYHQLRFVWLVVFVTISLPSFAAEGFRAVEAPGSLVLFLDEQQVAEFVYRDPQVLRPFFANVCTLRGTPATRPHPPRPVLDATDHDTMHPGIWIAFGDINGSDFWRNGGRIEQVRFLQPPTATVDRLTFACLSRLVTADGSSLGSLESHYQLRRRPAGWALDWETVFTADQEPLCFGDQEEMGFAARMATELTEDNGGHITTSAGHTSATTAWGQPAEWCDTTGIVDGASVGITLIPDAKNFRKSWWHTRAYGVFVANPFGRAAMRQGSPSSVVVPPGMTLTLRFTAVVHEGADYDISQEVHAAR